MGGAGAESERDSFEVDMRMTYSEREVLSEKDFEQMSVAEIQVAREAIARMRRALSELTIEGIKTTIPLHKRIMRDNRFLSGTVSTSFLEKLL